MDRATIKRMAVRLNGGAARGSSLALAHAMGVPVKTARAWMLDPGEPNYRSMSRTAKRLFATLVLLESTHNLSAEFIEAVSMTERLLEAGDLQREPS